MAATEPTLLARSERKHRGLVDTIGFAHRPQQIEAVVERIAAKDGARLERTLADKRIATDDRWRIAIAPHDDYAYVGYLYGLATARADRRAIARGCVLRARRDATYRAFDRSEASLPAAAKPRRTDRADPRAVDVVRANEPVGAALARAIATVMGEDGPSGEGMSR